MPNAPNKKSKQKKDVTVRLEKKLVAVFDFQKV